MLGVAHSSICGMCPTTLIRCSRHDLWPTLADSQVVAAWDISTVANRVYHHNHHRTPSPSSIDNLDSRALDRWQADLWMLSPPCQPHTRNNTTVQLAAHSLCH